MRFPRMRAEYCAHVRFASLTRTRHSAELRDLAAKLLESAVRELMKDAVRGEFDLTRPPVTVLRAPSKGSAAAV